MIWTRLAESERTGWQGFFAYLLRRIQRIVPPMLVVILVSVLVGMLLLWWKDADLQSKLGYAACLARVNVALRHEFANYFAPDAGYIPLLHLWYLSVILQVYLLYAIGNQVLQRLPRGIIVVVLTLLGAASLLYNYNTPLVELLAFLGVPTENLGVDVSYYQTLPRLWEVLAGGLVCVLPDLKRAWLTCFAVIVGLVGVLIAVFSPVILGANTLAQLPHALIVVLGTVLLLRYTPQCRVVHKVLSHRSLVWLGRISFSLYLVHLPVVVYMRVWTLGQPGLWVELLMLVISILLGYLFMVGVERRHIPFWATVVLWGITLILCRAGRKTGGFRNYLPVSNWEMPSYTEWKMCDDEPLSKGLTTDCFPRSMDIFNVMNQLDRVPGKVSTPLMVMGKEQKPVTCVLIGDSHAASIYAGMDAALKDEQISGVYLSSHLGPFHGWQGDKKSRQGAVSERKKAFMRWLRSHTTITHVIVAQRWHVHFDAEPQQKEHELRLFLRDVRDTGKKVVLIGPAPEFPDQSLLLHFDKAFTLRHISPAEVEKTAAVCGADFYLQINETTLSILTKLRDEGLCALIEPLKALRSGETFRTVQDGKLIMVDDNHMNAGLSVPLMQKLRPFLRAALK